MTRTRKIIAITATALAATAGGLGIAAAAGADVTTRDDDDDRPLSDSQLERASDVAVDEAGGGRVTDSEAERDGPGVFELEVTRDDGSEVDVHLDRAYTVVRTERDDDRGSDGRDGDDDDRDGDDADDRALTGQQRTSASEAALAHVGGGRVTDTEAGDGTAAFEVEVTRADGTEIDVHLDEQFTVIGDETDAPDDSDDDQRDDQTDDVDDDDD